MRVRPLPLIGVIFGAAALAAAFVVAQLPREGEVSAPAPATALPAPPAPAATPPLDPPATAADGLLEVRVSAGGEPQPGAEVRLYGAEGDAGWRRAGEARTAADGTARLLARPGAYLVAVRAPGLAPARAETVRHAGEEVTRSDVALEPPGALDGSIVARQGGPVAGARVRVVPVVSRWPGFEPPSAPAEETALAESGPSGAFRVEGLAPGTYAVAVDAPGFHPLLRPRVPVPGDALSVALEPLGRLEGIVLDGGRPAAGATVRAASAEHGAAATCGADGRFALAAPTGSYRVHALLGDRAAAAAVALAAGETTGGLELRLGPAATIEGEVVLASSGKPLAGAEVALFPHETGEVAARARTDAAGRFRLTGLPADAFDARASAPGATPGHVAGLSLAPGADFPLRLALAGTGAAEGTVTDLAGRALAGVRVHVVRRGDGLAAAPLEARTGFDGSWRIDGLEIGRAEIVARQDGVAVGTSHAVRVQEGRASRADLALPEAGRLSGRVRPDGKVAPAGTTVVAVPMRAGLGTLQVARAAVDASGSWALALPAGEYRVHAAPAGAARTDLRAAPAFVSVEAGTTSRLDLAPASAVAEEGVEILVLEPGGAPSPGAVVTLSRPDDTAVAFAASAGEDGRVVLGREMGVAGRRVAIRARNGGRAGGATVELPASGTVPVRLSPGGVVLGKVRAAGRAVSGFALEVTSQPSPAAWRTVEVHRFAGDRFELGDLPSEPLRLVVRADDGRRGQVELRVGPGEVRAVEIALGR